MEPSAGAPSPPASSSVPSPASRALHLTALSSFAIAQPVFEFLLTTPTFLVARGAPALDTWALTLGLLLVPPVALLLLEQLAGVLSRRLGELLHLALIGALLALAVHPPLLRAADPWALWPLLAAGLAGALASWAYSRSAPARSFLSVLSLAPLLFGGLFVLSPALSEVLWPEPDADAGEGPSGTETTVVFVIFDELPLTSLMNADQEIDPILFPNFARLASQSTWFRNATARHHSTSRVVPTILTGLTGLSGSDGEGPPPLPTLKRHPHNLFTLFRDSHRLVVQESLTRLAPREASRGPATERPGFAARLAALTEDLAFVYGHAVLPFRLARQLPAVDQNWGGFRNRGAFDQKPRFLQEFIDSIDSSAEPTLYYLHVLLPHAPWRLMPSGREYPVPGSVHEIVSKSAWGPDEGPTALGFQQHLLQLGFVDRMLGRLLDRLEQTAVFDRALIAVMADHGMSFRPNGHRRVVSAKNLRDVLHIPLFLKLPGQREARRNDRNVESVDILPTLADALDIAIPWAVDGSSGLDLAAAERPTKRIAGRQGESFEVPAALPDAWDQLDRRVRLFGPHPTWADVLRMGTEPQWIGQRTQDLVRETAAVGSVAVAGLERFEDVDLSAPSLPCYVWGEVFAASGAQPPERIALALNGIVRSAAPTWERGEQSARFGVMLSEDDLRAGRNQLEVFAVNASGALVPMAVRGD